MLSKLIAFSISALFHCNSLLSFLMVVAGDQPMATPNAACDSKTSPILPISLL